MSAHGGGIPRLQELSYLEVTAIGVHEGATFEDIRKRLVEHMIALRATQPTSRDVEAFRLARDVPTRYVRNAAEALKELMRLGLLSQAAVPSTASAAKSYRGVTFALTDKGKWWVAELRTDARAAYDNLFAMLWQVHPQFAGYLRVIGADGLAVPLAAWGDVPEPRSRERYLGFLVDHVIAAVEAQATGWTATGEEVRAALLRYTREIAEGAETRGRPDPFKRNQDFVKTCEEALVKLAFDKRGVPIDFISQEIIRRWTKELGLSGFSYHVPGPSALRYWPTATIEHDSGSVRAIRSGGPEARDRIIKLLPESFARARREDASNSSWVPIYRVRADVCWRLRLPDAQFDKAVVELAQGHRGADAPYGIHLELAQIGNVPPTELPLSVPHAGRTQWYYTMSLVPKHPRISEPVDAGLRLQRSN